VISSGIEVGEVLEDVLSCQTFGDRLGHGGGRRRSWMGLQLTIGLS